MQGLSPCQTNNLSSHDAPYRQASKADAASSWPKHHQDPMTCHHGSSTLSRLPSLTEEQRVQQYQNNQHLNVEGWPLLPSNQSSQTHFMTLGRRNMPQSQHRCNLGGPTNHRFNALSRSVSGDSINIIVFSSFFNTVFTNKFDGNALIYLHFSQGYDSQCGNSSTFRGSLELSHNSVSAEPHEYATLGVPPPQPVVNLNSSDGMATAIPSMAMAPMARGESVSSSTSTNASNNYTQYHHTTSDKPKKRVTIMESNNSESCV